MGAQMMSGLSQKKWIGNLDPDIHHILLTYGLMKDKASIFFERSQFIS